MTNTRSNGGGSPSPACGEGRRAMATSLFGGAILATVVTASLAQQVTYFPTATALNSGTVTSGYVVLGANILGDDGGGVLMPSGGTVCTPDNGIVFRDNVSNCFYRADPTYSVREWGALCDVVAVNAAGTAFWSNGPSGSGLGTLTVPTVMLSRQPNSAGGQFIAISQIGSPTLFGTLTPAVSLTRYSTLSNYGTNYSAGDLISFVGTTGNTGTFSQEAAIYVDAVDKNTGAITQWHFLFGGLYGAANPPTGTMVQDTPRSYCGNTCGTSGTLAGGATLAPAWSGWSVLNSQSISNMGTGYTIGQTVTLTSPGAVVNHYVKLVVEGTTSSGGVAAFDWTDYGSFSTLTNWGTLSDLSNPSTGLAFNSVAWTQGPYASTINTVTNSGTMTSIVVNGTAAFPGTMAVQAFYYGDDDSGPIKNALAAMPASALIIPAGCGTTAPLDLAVDTSANNLNPALVGSNLQSSGLYAFALPPASRTNARPVLSSVLYAGLLNNTGTKFAATQGGGFRNLLVEGFGVTEGYGYYGMVESVGTATGYMGPPSGDPFFGIPVAGSAVELDNATGMRIDNVHISDGGIGMGNAAMFCGTAESDPTNALKGSVGSLVFTESRLDANPAFFAGPSNPDVALNLHCHDSIFQNLTAFDGIKADVLGPGGNIFGQIHVGSSTINQTTATNEGGSINWPFDSPLTNVGFAGVADYGVYFIGNATLSQTRCDIANIACVFMSVDFTQGRANPGQITDTQVGCASFTSVPPGYDGVLLSAGVQGVTVSGTASAGKCAVPPAQLVSLLTGPPPDLTTSLCNNSNAPIAACTGYQGGFASGQFYTQPAVAYGTAALSANILYAVPFYSPAGGGTVNHLSVQVTSHGTAGSQCDLGIYSAFAGRPASRIVDGGTISVATTGTPTTTGSLSTSLAPATLYFLAAGCNGTVSVTGVTSTGAAAAPLTGAPDMQTTTSELTAGWSFGSGLPSSFPAPATITAGGSVPNVYANR
jgi:hypothetical protein